MTAVKTLIMFYLI